MKSPKGLAVDWIGKRLYIIESATNRVISTDLDGGNRVEIAPTGAKPMDIVVDPTVRLIFWSTIEHGIHAASMDGGNHTIIVRNNIEWPTALSIDHPTQRIYWTDQRKGTIETVLFDGRNRQTIATFFNKSEFVYRQRERSKNKISLLFHSISTKTTASIRRHCVCDHIRSTSDKPQ